MGNDRRGDNGGFGDPGGWQADNFAGETDGFVRALGGMPKRVSEVNVDGLPDEDFRLVDTRLMPIQGVVPGDFGVALGRGVDGGFGWLDVMT